MGWIDEKRLPNGLQQPLTPAQRKVACQVARGFGYAEIAGELAISEDAVRAHVRGIAAKLANPKRLPPMKQVRQWAVQQRDLQS